MKTLIVVDMQNDFITDALGTEEAVAILPKVIEKINKYKSEGERIIYTRDTHGNGYLNTPEGAKLPVVHCVKGTHGWEIADGLYVDGCEIIDKPTFGYTGWDKIGIDSSDNLELIGLCTDICVVSNALILKATFPELNISVDASCCAGVTPESHNAALTTMKMCQIDVVGE